MFLFVLNSIRPDHFFFNHVGTGLPGSTRYLSEAKVSWSRTQCFVTGEARTRNMHLDRESSGSISQKTQNVGMQVTIIPLDPEIVSICTKIVGWDVLHQLKQCAEKRSAVDNVSGYRYVSDCRSWGRELVNRPRPGTILRGD